MSLRKGIAKVLLSIKATLYHASLVSQKAAFISAICSVSKSSKKIKDNNFVFRSQYIFIFKENCFKIYLNKGKWNNRYHYILFNAKNVTKTQKNWLRLLTSSVTKISQRIRFYKLAFNFKTEITSISVYINSISIKLPDKSN